MRVWVEGGPALRRTRALFASPSILRNMTSGNSAASLFSSGSIIWQGPHQVAKKSTTTGAAFASLRACFRAAPPLTGLTAP